MRSTWPIHNEICKLAFSVARCLDVDAMVQLSVDELFFVFGWFKNSDMGAVDATDHILEMRHIVKCTLAACCFVSVWHANKIVDAFAKSQ